MKKYDAPEMNIVRFETEDVITDSNFIPDPNEGDLV